MARIEAVVRRRKRAAARTDVGPMVAGELEIRADQYQAFVSGAEHRPHAPRVRAAAAARRGHGQVIEREDIYQKVWGYAMAHGDRSVDVFVRKLRQKLQRHSASWRYIHTHFGIGYRFDPEPIADMALATSRARSDQGCPGRIARRGPRPTHPSRPSSALHTAFTRSSLDRNDSRPRKPPA